ETFPRILVQWLKAAGVWCCVPGVVRRPYFSKAGCNSMNHRMLAVLGLAGLGIFSSSFAQVVPDQGAGSAATPTQHIVQFLQQHPGAHLYYEGDHVAMVYGSAFSSGASPQASAE